MAIKKHLGGYILFLAIVVIAASCSNSNTIEEKALRLSISTYYQNELEKNWENLYSFRRDEFKQVVSFDTFLKTMENDSSGFALESFKIKEMNIKGEKATVKMEFVTLVNDPSYVEGIILPFRESQSEVRAEWIKRKGRWILLDSNRAHRALEKRIVYEPVLK